MSTLQERADEIREAMLFVVNAARNNPNMDYIEDIEFNTHEFYWYSENDSLLSYATVPIYGATLKDWLYVQKKFQL